MSRFNSKEFKLMKLRGKKPSELLDDLELYIEDLIDSNQRLRERIKEFNKDDEIAKIKDELNRTRTNSIMVMSDKEKKDARAFSEKHYKSCKSNTIYILEGTGIGTSIEVKCKKCGESENITDVDSW